ncbi:MAG: thioredoxin domain-containing protein [Dehalococcoidia bacterium]|nr:thioredoxin domain-containing protein [Dehalococcoidia bacterium]
MPNHLINETSPYLLQHANNPVDWYPWGEEALSKAQGEDKPILLSIGYSACHWCHVMERESFEDPGIARIMNENYVCIKVDREERPDLDSIYMNAVQALTGGGGWPMTVFLTPDARPFYGGNYFPPEDRGGMVGFPKLLARVAEAFRSRRGEVVQTTNELLNHIQPSPPARSADPLSSEVLHDAMATLVQGFDFDNGGFGSAPKFPQPMIYEFLLNYHHINKDPFALQMVEMSAERMGRGGMYDQIGGGFHRYSTDAHWLVPHFEKMLYDNALLSRLYLHLFQATGNGWYQRIAEETLDYVLREMTDPAGGFYSTQDADSEGVEGKFFVWSIDEIAGLLGPVDGPIVAGYLGASEAGNFEGRNIFHLPEATGPYAEKHGLSIEELIDKVQQGKASLLEERETRIHPARDEKVLTAWNGLMIRSFAEAASILGRDDYRQAALNSATFILDNLRKDGRLLRTYKDGQAKLNGYLEDYACMAHGLLALYEATFDARWFDEANALGRDMVDLFWDEAQGIFYDTSRDHEALVVRPRDFFDNATPCGGSVATGVLLQLGVLTGDGEYSRRASAAMHAVQQHLARIAQGMGRWLANVCFYTSAPKEIAIIGDPSSADTQALMREVYQRYLPNKVVAGAGAPVADDHATPLLQERGMIDGKPTAYVCENYSCQLPVTTPEELASQLEQ